MRQTIVPAKKVNETLLITFNFFDQLLFGEVLSAPVVTVEVISGFDYNPNLLLAAPATFSGSIVTQKVSGGMAGVTYALTATVTGSLGHTYQVVQNMAVLSQTGFAPASFPALTGTLPDGVVGVAYSHNLQITGGYAPYAPIALVFGAPPWMGFAVVDDELMCFGMPAEDADTSYVFTAEIEDAALTHATSPQAIDVTRVFITGDAPGGVVTQPYSYTYSFGQGTPPYTFSVSSGAIPTGLTLNPATAELSGTPSAEGIFSWVARVTDANGVISDQPDSAEMLFGVMFALESGETYLRYSIDGGISWNNTVETGGSGVVDVASGMATGNNQLQRHTPLAGRYSPDGLTNYADCVVPGATGFVIWILWSGAEWLRRSTGALTVSPDGITFVNRAVPSFGVPNDTFRAVAKLGNVIVSSYQSGTNRGLFASQDNGLTWVAYIRSLLNTYTALVAVGPPYNYILGTTGASGRVDMTVTGANDAAWTNNFGTIATPNFTNCMAYSPTLQRLIAVTDGVAVVYYSDDGGVNWINAGVNFPQVIYGLAYWLQDRFFYIHNSNTTMEIWHSLDGLSWTMAYSKPRGAGQGFSLLVSF